MIGYVAKDLGSGERLAGNDDVQLPSSSTIEVLIAAAFWRAVARGELERTPSVRLPALGERRGERGAARLPARRETRFR